jgi:hypothetical protein
VLRVPVDAGEQPHRHEPLVAVHQPTKLRRFWRPSATRNGPIQAARSSRLSASAIAAVPPPSRGRATAQAPIGSAEVALVSMCVG